MCKGKLFSKHPFIYSFKYCYICYLQSMINGKKLVVVLPAYNAALTLEQTYREIPFDIVDDVVLVDDHSKDNTIFVFEEQQNYLRCLGQFAFFCL